MVDRVTVVIPAWGRYTALLAEALTSVRAAGEHVRVVVVDNANAPVLSGLDGCDVIRSEAELSRGAARNLGLSRVNTEYVVFLDADDLLLPLALDRLVAELDARPRSPALIGRIVEPSGAPYPRPRALTVALGRRPRLLAWANAAWSLLPMQGCTLMRTEAVRAVGGYGDRSVAEDRVLGASLAFAGPIAFSRDPTLVYRARPDSPGVVLPGRRTLLDNAAAVRARLLQAALITRVESALLAAAQATAVVARCLLWRLSYRTPRTGAAGTLMLDPRSGTAGWHGRISDPAVPSAAGQRRVPARASTRPPDHG